MVATDERLEILRKMHELRFFENECDRLFRQGQVKGPTHLYQGQEAVSVGVCAALRPGDTMTCTYRGHGATLAMGAPLDKTFGEIFGKAGGLCGGKGGSMHLTDAGVGALGSNAIVGAHLPIANGAAFAAMRRGTGAVHACFFGDGSTNIGTFHEALNLASLWKLPVLFICENNLYGEYSPRALTTPIERLADRGISYGMNSLRIDGNEVLTVKEIVEGAAERARSGEGPTLIEAMTYRHQGHSRTDPAPYRPDGELEEWLERDPILLLEGVLESDGVGADDLTRIREEAEKAVADARDTALAWPDPELDERFDHVWAS
ncbi:MAG: thiamine pyrophosphate-dependent dehydrogenase E1 component subunit alpha [Actinobacteria bacterium]|nr:thiamine pyrophosphate-dependent dehydrogenase E1 component subunit alpha [Actinomycetota bacterium]